MKYVMTLIWSMLLSFIISYILSSMADDPFILNQALVLGGVFFVAIVSLGAVIAPKEHAE